MTRYHNSVSCQYILLVYTTSTSSSLPAATRPSEEPRGSLSCGYGLPELAYQFSIPVYHTSISYQYTAQVYSTVYQCVILVVYCLTTIYRADSVLVMQVRCTSASCQYIVPVHHTSISYQYHAGMQYIPVCNPPCPLLGNHINSRQDPCHPGTVCQHIAPVCYFRISYCC